MATLVLTVNPLPVLAPISGINKLCATTSALLTNTQSGGSWSSADNNIATVDNTGLLSAISYGSTVISYSYTDNNGCNSIVMKSVSVDSTPVIPTVSTSGLTTICNSWGSITLTSSVDSNNQWYKNNILITGQINQSYKPLSSGNYTVVTSYSNGCFATSAPAAINVNMPATPVVSALGSTSVCLGNCVRLSSSSGYSSYQWFKDGVQISNADNLDFFACGTGNYYVITTDGTGCQSDTSNKTLVTVSTIAQPTVQAISGTSTLCPGDSVLLTDITPGGIWTIDSTSIATVDSITGLVKGLVQGTAVLSYTIGNPDSACSATATVPLTVNCNVVASGSTGGLESKGLGDAVARRVYNAALSGKSSILDYSKLLPVNTSNLIHVMGTTTPGVLTLSNLMPDNSSIGCGFKSYDMSSYVTDLTSFTNAAEVETYDYVAKNETQSVTFLTRTYNNIYEHTKTICDRLKEAKILDIQQVSVQGMTFIQYELQQNDGKIEYAISFSAGVKQNDNRFAIQSLWLTKNYAVQDTMYNFQVWSVAPAMTQNMVNNILNKLSGVLPLNPLVDSIGVPSTYISDVTRYENKLIMNIRNNTSSTNGSVDLTVRSNENITTTSPLSVPVTLLPNAVTQVVIDVKDSYESDISLSVDNNLIDMAYMNDGNWSYSLSNTANVPNNFTISNDGIMPDSNEYRLFRNVTIDVNVPDYVSLYKMMKAGGLSRDLTAYNQLLFKASAANAGKLTIMIQKASITGWSDQFTYTLPVNGNLQDYVVNLKDFRSAGSNDTLNADDVVTVTFSFIGNGNNNHIVASLADVKFAKAAISAPVAIVNNTMNVYPNPAIDRFNITFQSEKNTTLNMELIQMGSGKVIISKQVNVTVGTNIIPVIVNSAISSDGHYVLMLGNETIKYTPFKLALRR